MSSMMNVIIVLVSFFLQMAIERLFVAYKVAKIILIAPILQIPTNFLIKNFRNFFSASLMMLKIFLLH
jgi:hypothetical protein